MYRTVDKLDIGTCTIVPIRHIPYFTVPTGTVGGTYGKVPTVCTYRYRFRINLTRLQMKLFKIILLLLDWSAGEEAGPGPGPPVG